MSSCHTDNDRHLNVWEEHHHTLLDTLFAFSSALCLCGYMDIMWQKSSTEYTV
eukprot:m.94424 g.94424  ORF g.94424 m.94424 type:complete len:53 (+) comp16542_c0_seq4:366-524(+)